jgi:hypothetical protein
MIRALGQLFFGNSFADQYLGLLRLLLLLLLMCSLEFHLLYECTDKSHGCIRMNATCLVNPM